MKFREIFRFEFVYQARRVRTWLYFAVAQFPIYLMPAMLKPLARRFAAPASTPASR